MGGLLMALSEEPGEEPTKLQIISVYALSGTTPPVRLYKSPALLKGSPFHFLKIVVVLTTSSVRLLQNG